MLASNNQRNKKECHEQSEPVAKKHEHQLDKSFLFERSFPIQMNGEAGPKTKVWQGMTFIHLMKCI